MLLTFVSTIADQPNGRSWSASRRLGEGWCQGRESNPRPKAYESSALPLSYPGDDWNRRAAISH